MNRNALYQGAFFFYNVRKFPFRFETGQEIRYNTITFIDLTLTMQTLDTDWTDTEKNVARTAFNKAYERELSGLMQAVREGSNQIEKPDDLWRLHDLLSAKRHEIDGKYDYRYSALMFVFAGLVKEGWLSIDELSGLQSNKIAKIVALSRM
jgi:hypothetical protein